MIRRRQNRFNRITHGFFRLLLRAGTLALLYTLVSFALLRSTRPGSAVTVHAPHEDDAPVLPSKAPDHLRVLTYNIAHGRGPGFLARNQDGGDRAEKLARLEAIARDLQALRLDVVLLNEVDFHCPWSFGMDQADIIARTAGFPYVVKQRNIDTGIPGFARWSFGNALLSRFPVEDATILRLPPYSHFENVFAGNHDGLIARVRTGGNQLVTFVGVHLEVRSEEIRVQCASRIVSLQRETKTPMVVMGDFNSTLPGFPGAQTAEKGQNAMEVLDSFGSFLHQPVRGRGTPAAFTYPTAGPKRVIDWILPDTSWAFVEYGVVHRVAHSDHLPVQATLRQR